MDVGGALSRIAAGAARRPWLTLALVGALALAGALAALSLRPTAATDTLVGRSSADYRETQRFYSHFGEEPVEVLVQGDLRKLLLSSDVDRLVGLEGCISGRVPAAALPTEGGKNGPCGQIDRTRAVKVVFGPATFLAEAARQIDATLASRSAQAEHQATLAQHDVYRSAIARGMGSAQASTLGEQARRATMAGLAAEVSALAIRYGISRPPTLDEHDFVSQVVFDPTKPGGVPKQRFAYLFPSRESALVSVRLRAGLSESQRAHAIALIRAAVVMPQWRLANGERYLVTGEPAIVAEVTSSLAHSIELLLVAVLVVMALVLGLVFRGRPRLLPLGVALLATALTFGVLALSGAELTMASVAVLPVLVGLAVDYAIQFQSRVREESLAGRAAPEAIARAAARGGPTILTAAVASAGGILVLLLSPVPMVRGFGVLLVVGLALAFLCALTAGSAAMALVARGKAGTGAFEPAVGTDAGRGAVFAPFLAAWRGAGELLSDNPLTRWVADTALRRAVAHPGRVLAVGLALAVLGWGLDTQTQVQTDIAKLAPQDLSSLRNLTALEHATGVGGEIDLTVSSPSGSLAKPATIGWMSSYESAILRRFGYSATAGCARARLCPAFSLPDLFQREEGTQGKLTAPAVSGLLAAIPSYFSQGVISADHRTATVAFGIRLMSLQRQQQVIEAMRAGLHPPAGVSAHLVGLSVLAAGAGAALASPGRRALTLLAALALVAAILLAVFRGDRRRALVPLAPIALASGWSALVLFALQIPLNPMSVTLGALVIAISTEFSVLLAERYRQELASGWTSREALARAYRGTGAAVAASGVTAIAGFGVLALSDIAMLRDFGIVTLLDLSVSLLGVLIALPAAIVVSESAPPLGELLARVPRPRAPRPRAGSRGLTAP
ncbi:MAG TPA: MMPL family transporter [Solirubrobacteraceae bacterium]|nr:MMPL family transporter [Solirubrobacteraceae bacterium]